MDLIYQHYVKGQPTGSIWQCGYREIPWNLETNDPPIHLVIFAARECPPLNHFTGACLEYFPNLDLPYQKGTTQYAELLSNALAAVPSVVSAVRQGKNVLNTCAVGINRSGLVTALSMKQLNKTLGAEEIIKTIQNQRSCGALTNPAFNTMILEA